LAIPKLHDPKKLQSLAVKLYCPLENNEREMGRGADIS
jgi:hypothetical protein